MEDKIASRDGTRQAPDPSTILIEIDGVRRTVREVARERGIPLSTARWRIARGWDPAQAATVRSRPRVGRGHLDRQGRATGLLRRRIREAVVQAARRALLALNRTDEFARNIPPLLPRRLGPVDASRIRVFAAWDGLDVVFGALIPPLRRRVLVVLREPVPAVAVRHGTDVAGA